MNGGDRFRIIVILSYVMLIVCAVILFISVWNKLSMNTEVNVGNGMYFLILSMVILSSVIFSRNILEQSDKGFSENTRENIPDEFQMHSISQQTGSFISPFEVDLDLLAAQIIPRIDLRDKTEEYAERILLNISKHFKIVQGVFFLKNQDTGLFESVSTFAYTSNDDPTPFRVGEGLPGQVAKNRTLLHLTSLPEGYLKIQSGLGNSTPANLLIIPLLPNKETIGIIELASFRVFDEETLWTLKTLAKMLGNAMITKLKGGG